MKQLNRPSHTIKITTWTVAGGAIVGLALALSAQRLAIPVVAATSPQEGSALPAPVLASFPAGYRDWGFISVATVGSPVNDIRAKLGNDVAMRAFQAGKLPFPDGAIIARLAWRRVTSEQTNNALAQEGKAKGLSADAIQKLLDETFVAGPPTNVQFMVKDSTKYGSTGGWGFAQFTNGKPDSIAVNSCFACHAPGKDRDFVFTSYSP